MAVHRLRTTGVEDIAHNTKHCKGCVFHQRGAERIAAMKERYKRFVQLETKLTVSHSREARWLVASTILSKFRWPLSSLSQVLSLKKQQLRLDSTNFGFYGRVFRHSSPLYFKNYINSALFFSLHVWSTKDVNLGARWQCAWKQA